MSSLTATPPVSSGIRDWISRHRIFVITLSCVSVIAVLLLGAAQSTPGPSASTIRVEKSPFRVAVTSRGTIEPLSTSRVISQCQWTVEILSLVPEGTWVRKGDVVCVLDSSKIEEYLRTREVSLIKANAALEYSLRQEELVQARNERLLREAEHQLMKAEMDLMEYTEGTHPNSIEKFQDEIEVCQDQLNTAEQAMRFTEELWMLGYTNRPEVDRAALARTTQLVNLRRLESSQNLLESFRHPRQTAELNYRVSNSRLNVVRTSLANSIAESRAKMGSLSDQRRQSIFERYVRGARDSVAACTLRAPRDGRVRHCNNWYRKSRGSITIEEGKSVYFSQPIFEIPEEDHLKVRFPLDESLITRVDVGTSVTVSAVGHETDSLPARVVRISSYPTARYNSDVREYMLEAVFDVEERRRHDYLQAGIDAEAQLTLFQKQDAITVPAESVIRHGGQNVVLVRHGEDLLPCRVITGEVAEGRVLIESGLHEGDEIVASVSDRQKQQLEELLAETLR